MKNMIMLSILMAGSLAQAHAVGKAIGTYVPDVVKGIRHDFGRVTRAKLHIPKEDFKPTPDLTSAKVVYTNSDATKQWEIQLPESAVAANDAHWTSRGYERIFFKPDYGNVTDVRKYEILDAEPDTAPKFWHSILEKLAKNNGIRFQAEHHFIAPKFTLSGYSNGKSIRTVFEHNGRKVEGRVQIPEHYGEILEFHFTGMDQLILETSMGKRIHVVLDTKNYTLGSYSIVPEKKMLKKNGIAEEPYTLEHYLSRFIAKERNLLERTAVSPGYRGFGVRQKAVDVVR